MNGCWWWCVRFFWNRGCWLLFWLLCGGWRCWKVCCLSVLWLRKNCLRLWWVCMSMFVGVLSCLCRWGRVMCGLIWNRWCLCILLRLSNFCFILLLCLCGVIVLNIICCYNVLIIWCVMMLMWWFVICVRKLCWVGFVCMMLMWLCWVWLVLLVSIFIVSICFFVSWGVRWLMLDVLCVGCLICCGWGFSLCLLFWFFWLESFWLKIF